MEQMLVLIVQKVLRVNVWSLMRATAAIVELHKPAINNRGKRIIVLTGANHHNRAVNELKKVRSVNLVTQVQDH